MRSATEAGEGVPAFLAKLWKLVDDLRTNHLISWAQVCNTDVSLRSLVLLTAFAHVRIRACKQIDNRRM